MMKHAEKSIIIMTTEQGMIEHAEVLKNTFEKAKRKGVKIKIAAPLTKESNKAVLELGKYAEIRNTKEKARFCIIDGKEVMFMLLDDATVHNSYDCGIWVNTKLFAQTLENFFNASWSKIKPEGKFMNAA